jgi:hypothetical protein
VQHIRHTDASSHSAACTLQSTARGLLLVNIVCTYSFHTFVGHSCVCARVCVNILIKCTRSHVSMKVYAHNLTCLVPPASTFDITNPFNQQCLPDLFPLQGFLVLKWQERCTRSVILLQSRMRCTMAMRCLRRLKEEQGTIIGAWSQVLDSMMSRELQSAGFETPEPVRSLGYDKLQGCSCVYLPSLIYTF